MLQLISSGWMASWVCIVLPLVDDMNRKCQSKFHRNVTIGYRYSISTRPLCRQNISVENRFVTLLMHPQASRSFPEDVVICSTMPKGVDPTEDVNGLAERILEHIPYVFETHAPSCCSIYTVRAVKLLVGIFAYESTCQLACLPLSQFCG